MAVVMIIPTARVYDKRNKSNQTTEKKEHGIANELYNNNKIIMDRYESQLRFDTHKTQAPHNQHSTFTRTHTCVVVVVARIYDNIDIIKVIIIE